MKTVKCTQRALDQVMATVREVGYSGLDRHQKDVADAFDAGTLVVIEPVYREYNVMEQTFP